MPQLQSNSDLRLRIRETIVSLLDGSDVSIDETTPLIGDGSVMDSMKLVELCLKLEDMALDIGFEFDWTSVAAMSKSRGMFRTAGALADEFMAQLATKK